MSRYFLITGVFSLLIFFQAKAEPTCPATYYRCGAQLMNNLLSKGIKQEFAEDIAERTYRVRAKTIEDGYKFRMFEKTPETLMILHGQVKNEFPGWEISLSDLSSCLILLDSRRVFCPGDCNDLRSVTSTVRYALSPGIDPFQRKCNRSDLKRIDRITGQLLPLRYFIQ